MSMIAVTRSDSIKLICRAADSAVHAYLNGDEAYSKQGVAERGFTDERQLAASLQDGYNVLNVLGVNWGDNYLYDVRVELNGNAIASHVELNQPAGSRPRGIVWDFAVEFNMT